MAEPSKQDRERAVNELPEIITLARARGADEALERYARILAAVREEAFAAGVAEERARARKRLRIGARVAQETTVNDY